MNKTQSEGIGDLQKADKLGQTLLAGIHGIPEIRRDEKRYHLGEFKERILRKLSKKQVTEAAIYPEVFQTLKDQRVNKLILNGEIDRSSIEKYRVLARRVNKNCTVRIDPSFKGDTGLVVASNQAVEEQEITVVDRSLRLQRLGLSTALIQAAGKKVCRECIKRIVEVDENELINYHQLTWIDRLGGERCPVHSKKV
ncbi:YueI family protein [Pelosinus sp. UFO1]|uniref:YueI family protein n=1 Tax=Pelosinus sp. UFO1 TaxID=484770 RepID=UPI0004D0F25C|nr:YueI family protein [Pelosinus sp. UFO1]AIF50402.1 protein of unknown function DUF1694 [Pelosinus sp. UFO1]